MIGLDTNVLLRYLLGDDRRQFMAAAHLVDDACSESSPGYVGTIVLAELWWVLRRSVKLSKTEAGEAISALINNPHIRVERPDSVIAALATSLRTPADFADCLIVADHLDAGASPTMSFDSGALAAGIMTAVPPRTESAPA